MKVSFIVDGQTEYHLLIPFLASSKATCELTKPILCDMQPYASISQIAYRISKKLPLILHKNPDLIVITIDHENRPCCAPSFANELYNSVVGYVPVPVRVQVVIKVSCFENWLISDIGSLGRIRGFSLSTAIQRRISPNKADNVDALRILKSLNGGNYDKISDGKRICKAIKDFNADSNSRSLRRMLRVLGHPKYTNQSKLPA